MNFFNLFAGPHNILEQFLKDLSELVNLDCGTHNTEGVTKAAHIMQRHFEALGWRAELVDLGPEVGKGLFATNKPEAEKFDLLMNAHLDTVFADGTAAARPFAVNGNIATGPGCSDCKAGVVSILYALKAADPKDLDRLAIAVCMDPDEETGSKNSAAWMRSIASRTKQGLVFEAARPNGALVRSRKGAYQLRVHVKGIAAHSGNNPKAGRSAILEAARMINEIAELSDFDGTGVTVNTGMISGGSAINVIAPECTFGVDIRAWTDKDMDEALAKIRDRAAHPSIDGVTISIDLFGITPAMPRSEAGSELVAKINKAAQLAGLSIDWVDAGGASDANHMAPSGFAVADGLGPIGNHAHSEKECLCIDSIEPRINMVVKLLSLL